jgi:ATP-binding cassette subfamily C protein
VYYLRYLQNNLAQRMRVRTESIFRNSLFQNLLDAKYEYLTNQSQAGISQVLVQEVNRISYSALLLVQILTSMILILTYMIVASFMSLQAVFIFVAFSALANLCIIKFRKNPVKMGEKIRQELSQFHQVLNQYMTGLKSIKIAGLEKFYTRQFQNISLRLEKIELEFTREQSKVKLIYEISIALSFSIGFFLLFSVLKMPVTALILCLLISLRLIPQIVEIQQKASQIRYFLPSYEAWDVMLSNARHLRERDCQTESREIRFKNILRVVNLGFSYRWNKSSFALKNISLEIPAGAFVGIRGKSGSGKTTFVDLLSGILQAQSGEIQIDGEYLSDFNARQWRSQVSYFNQDAFLFEGSIRENLTWSERAASDSELWEALEKVGAADFVQSLPLKLDADVKNSGANFSGGQRQRLALARVFLRRPSLLILDEATSHLDIYHQQALLKTLLALRGTVTIVVVSHSDFFLNNADTIIEINDGYLQCVKNSSIQHLA